MKPQGCGFCNDLRNIQPAKYFGGGSEEFKEFIQKAHNQKKFILISKNRFVVVHECPVCGYKFDDEDYDSY